MQIDRKGEIDFKKRLKIIGAMCHVLMSSNMWQENRVYVHNEDWTHLVAQAGFCMTPEEMAKIMATAAMRSVGKHVIWLKFNKQIKHWSWK